MKGRRSLLGLVGSLLLHGLAVLAALALVSREPGPAVVIVELGEAIRVGDAAARAGLPGSKSPRAPVSQRKPRESRSASVRPAEREPVPERAAEPEPSAVPSPAGDESPVAAPSSPAIPPPSGSQPAAGESIAESIGAGIPGGGPLAMLAPTGRGGEGGDGGIPSEFGPYLVRLRQRIQEGLSYPATARRRGLAGTVQLEIDLLPSGTVASVIVRSSSSHAVLDEAALETVRRLSPDPFPPGLQSRPLRIRLPIVFELQ